MMVHCWVVEFGKEIYIPMTHCCSRVTSFEGKIFKARLYGEPYIMPQYLKS